MSQQLGFTDPSFPTHICKLNKDIYRLHQALRAWYDEFKNHLFLNQFKPTVSDSSLFINKNTTSLIFILVYVYDIITTGPDPSLINNFIKTLATQFSLNDLANLSYFQGFVVPLHPYGLLFSKTKYVINVLTCVNMSDCKPATTNMVALYPPDKIDRQPLPSPTEY